MRFIYSIFLNFVWWTLHLIARFNPKIKLFVHGRKNTFSILEKNISEGDRVIWMHVASLGEFEQGLPILEQIKKDYPDFKMLLTFFSPSGYEVKKNTQIADVITYLPIDTQNNAKEFITIVKPHLAIFVKYEIWPNLLDELKKHGIHTILVSAIFSKKQIYFKTYGSFMKNSLANFTHFFVQNKESKDLLKTIGFSNISVSGDTRFDRVNKISQRDNTLDFMEKFRENNLCIVAGSTWPEDESILVNYINTEPVKLKYVIAPHTIKNSQINSLKESIEKKVICYTEINGKNLSDYEVLIVDIVGILTKIYGYADIAYVGGGFATGLHNTLEPASYGIPVIIGPKYINFKEAIDLVKLKGVLSINNHNEFREVIHLLINNSNFLEETGKINHAYIKTNIGATNKIIAYINKHQ